VVILPIFSVLEANGRYSFHLVRKPISVGASPWQERRRDIPWACVGLSSARFAGSLRAAHGQPEIARKWWQRPIAQPKPDTRAWETTLRPKPLKLSGSAFPAPSLFLTNSADCHRRQIAGWLKANLCRKQSIAACRMKRSYKCLFIQAARRSEKELQEHLRAHAPSADQDRPASKEKGWSDKGSISISERPASCGDPRWSGRSLGRWILIGGS